jgi:hypothetical protein
MIHENKAMAIAALTPPPSIEDAAARITEYTSSEPATGLIGLKFTDVYQFSSALRQASWKVLEEKIVMGSELASTYLFKVQQANIVDGTLQLRILVNQFRNGNADVINCAVVVENDVEEYWK